MMWSEHVVHFSLRTKQTNTVWSVGVCFGSYKELRSRMRHVRLWLSSVPCGKQHNEDGIPLPSGMNRFWHPSHTSTCWQPCSKLGGVFQSLERCGSSIHEEYLGLRWRCCQLRALPTWRQAILCSTHHSCAIHLLSENRSCRHLEFLWSDKRWPLLTAHTFNLVSAAAECNSLF